MKKEENVVIISIYLSKDNTKLIIHDHLYQGQDGQYKLDYLQGNDRWLPALWYRPCSSGYTKHKKPHR